MYLQLIQSVWVLDSEVFFFFLIEVVPRELHVTELRPWSLSSSALAQLLPLYRRSKC